MKRRMSLQDKAEAALKEAVKGVIENHKRTGRPLAIWRNGKVAWVSAHSLLRRTKRSYMKGIFITFEGSEGCGKSTQSKLLYNYLIRKGYKAVHLREPGGTKISERLRKILLDPKNHITPISEMLLYMVARAELVDKIIQPELSKGKIVICDRFLDSTFAYQGYGLGIDIKLIKNIGNFIAKGVQPDLTIFLDLPIKKGLKHRRIKQDRIEKRSVAYHRRVRKGYLKLAGQEPKRIKMVKVDRDKFVTQEKIRKLALDKISNIKMTMQN